MSAICPAGPPKLMKPRVSQKRKASSKVGGRPSASGPVTGCSGGLRRPIGHRSHLPGQRVRRDAGGSEQLRQLGWERIADRAEVIHVLQDLHSGEAGPPQEPEVLV